MKKFNIGERYRVDDEKHSEYGNIIKITGLSKDVVHYKTVKAMGRKVADSHFQKGSVFSARLKRVDDTIIIYRKSNTVIATDKSTGKTAQATCMDSDTFNLADGQKLAFYRLMGTQEEKIREMLPHLFEKKETEKPFVIKQDHYNVGDKVLIVDEFTPECNPDPKRKMGKWLGKVMTIRDNRYPNLYRMVEDNKEHINGWNWNTHCIAGKVIDGVKKVKRAAKVGEYVLIVDPFKTKGNYKKGDIVRISGTYGRYGNGHGEWLFEREYVVLEGYKPEMLGEIKPGDMVKVVSVGETYNMYREWKGLGKYLQNFVNGANPNTKDRYIVLNVGKHGGKGIYSLLALIQNPKTTQVFIVDVAALRKVEK